ncbi:FHA domain-containing protein [bacterium]|nr:FHA domain-containing protein [bacterium]
MTEDEARRERGDHDQTDLTEVHDEIEIVKAVRAREAAAGIPALAGFALVVTDGPQRGLHWPLEEGESGAGRNPGAYMFLDDVTVSRNHARFLVDGDLLTVQDLGSTNGTYINGARTDFATLRAGDQVIIGRFHLVVTRT